MRSVLSGPWAAVVSGSTTGEFAELIQFSRDTRAGEATSLPQEGFRGACAPGEQGESVATTLR
jgi:hypothetical protein